VELTSTVWYVCYLAPGNATSYVGVVLVLDEWASVCRPARCGSMHISNPFWASDLEETGVHRENDGPHGPAVDEAIMTLDSQPEMHMRRSKHFEDSRRIDLLRKRVTI
jgi:hypothetical protein